MSYVAAQAALKTLLATVTGLTSSVTEGDTAILDAGVENAVILLAGAVPPRDTAGRVRQVYWEVLADVLTRFDDTRPSAYNDFAALRDGVILVIDAAPCLSATYFVTEIVSDGDPVEMEPFIVQRLRITIQENV